MTKNYSNILVVDSKFMAMVDSHMTRAICDLVPSGFLSLSKSQHDDLAAECMISIGLIAAIFEADNSDKALSARQDHRDQTRSSTTSSTRMNPSTRFSIGGNGA